MVKFFIVLLAPFFLSALPNRDVCGYTERDSKIGIWQGGALNLGQALPAPKQLNLTSLAPGSPKTHRLWGGVQAGHKFSGCLTPPEPIFQSRAVCLFDEYPSVYFPASTHCLIGVSALGDSVELEDGSVWKICRYDGYKALSWRSNDPLTITQNHQWFSSYVYRIVNQNTGECLEAKLFLGPLAYGQHTLYITGIDRVSDEMIVTNGSGESIRWEISASDIDLFRNWALGDAVIIGQNSGWDSNYEALLINVNMNDSVRARQV